MKKFRILLATVITLSVSATAAYAHDPIIIEDSQTSPELGPLLPDGTVSFALYGQTTERGDTRSFRVRFADGDRLQVSLLIPDLIPENELDDEDLPSLELVDPQGSMTTLRTDGRVPFAEPFTGTNYVRLLEFVDVAMAGEYTITVVGGAPARFTVSVGFEELFGTPIEGVSNRDLGVEGVMAWYETPPMSSPEDSATGSSSTFVSISEASGSSSRSEPSRALVVIVWIVSVLALAVLLREIALNVTVRKRSSTE